MNIQHSSMKLGDQRGRQDAHESSQNQEVRLKFVQGRGQCMFSVGAAGIFCIVDYPDRYARFIGAFQAENAGPVTDYGL